MPSADTISLEGPHARGCYLEVGQTAYTVPLDFLASSNLGNRYQRDTHPFDPFVGFNSFLSSAGVVTELP
jgi:hypothetical protein